MDTQDLVLWGIGLIVSVIIGVWGLKTVTSRKIQNQKTGERSISIQSGRDTNVRNDE